MNDYKYALVLHPNRSMEIFKFCGHGSIPLKWMQSQVGGYIEPVGTAIQNLIMLVDEDGKVKNKPRNEWATDMLAFQLTGDFIVGDVLFLIAKGEELVGLTTSQLQSLILNFDTEVSI